MEQAILLVDIDDVTLLGLERYFPNYRLIFASNIQDGVSFLMDYEKQNIRLLITEMYLPENVEDFNAMEQLRQQKCELWDVDNIEEAHNRLESNFVERAITAGEIINRYYRRGGGVELVVKVLKGLRKRVFPVPVLLLTINCCQTSKGLVRQFVTPAKFRYLEKPAETAQIVELAAELLDSNPT